MLFMVWIVCLIGVSFAMLAVGWLLDVYHRRVHVLKAAQSTAVDESPLLSDYVQSLRPMPGRARRERRNLDTFATRSAATQNYLRELLTHLNVLVTRQPTACHGRPEEKAGSRRYR